MAHINQTYLSNELSHSRSHLRTQWRKAKCWPKQTPSAGPRDQQSPDWAETRPTWQHWYFAGHHFNSIFLLFILWEKEHLDKILSSANQCKTCHVNLLSTTSNHSLYWKAAVSWQFLSWILYLRQLRYLGAKKHTILVGNCWSYIFVIKVWTRVHLNMHQQHSKTGIQ